ncbi:MAG: Xaa-Pro peptidase family protein [Verrucomicrobiota bacterium]|nr:Xaa-Pro peptidase family protein [Verrucomicrobiota bacterium]
MKRMRTGRGNEPAVVVVGSATTSPDVVYATGFQAPDDVAFVRARGEFLLVSALEFGRASRVAGARGIRVLTPDSLKIPKRRRADVAEWVLRLLRREGVKSVVVSRGLPYGVGKRLEERGIRVALAAKPLFPGRARKAPEELKKIQESQQAAVIGMRRAVEMIARSEIDGSGALRARGRPLTSEAVRREIARALLEQDCFCGELIVAGGPQSADPHEQGSGPLRAREPIVIDIFPRHLTHGYWGDLTRTVVRGQASPRLKRMYHAVRAAHAAALGRLRPGVRASTVHKAAAAEITRRGFRTETRDGRPIGFIHGTGHGVGLAVHERPAVSVNRDRLESGNVVTIEPGLYYPDVGGVRIEDTVVVAPGGWRHLAPCEKRFEI